MNKIIYTTMSAVFSGLEKHETLVNNLVNVSTNQFNEKHVNFHSIFANNIHNNFITSVVPSTYIKENILYESKDKKSFSISTQNENFWLVVKYNFRKYYINKGIINTENNKLRINNFTLINEDGKEIFIPEGLDIKVSSNGNIYYNDYNGELKKIERLKFIFSPKKNLIEHSNQLFTLKNEVNDFNHLDNNKEFRLILNDSKINNVKVENLVVDMINNIRYCELNMKMIQNIQDNYNFGIKILNI